MKTRIIATPEILKYFNRLIDILYHNDYFGFEESAIKYVKDLFEDIELNLSTKTKKPAPEYFNKYGKNLYYTSFKSNRHTTWYVFFTIHYDYSSNTRIFLIRYVSNNHIVGKYLIEQI